MDETSDISRKEQVSFCCVRYINDNCDVQEHFIGITTINLTDGQTLVDTIEGVLGKHNLNIEVICGQAYDGAANMSGQYCGVQSTMVPRDSTAVYVHCQAHVLALLFKVQEDLNLDQTGTLKQISDTRWACRVESLKAVNWSTKMLNPTLSSILDYNWVYKKAGL